MSKGRIGLAAAVILALSLPGAQAQQLATTQTNIDAVVAHAMRDPDCQAAYKVFRAQRGTATFAQFAYMWLATASSAQRSLEAPRQVTADLSGQQ